MDKGSGSTPEASVSSNASAAKKTPPSVQSTALFRVLNPELFMKPNKVIMAVGISSVTLCVGYIAYMNAKSENKKTYMAMQEDGSFTKRTKSSKWD